MTRTNIISLPVLKASISILRQLNTVIIAWKSKKLAEAIKNSCNGPFLFIPYRSPDYLSLHGGIAHGNLGKHSITTVVNLRLRHNRFRIKKYINIAEDGLSFAAFEKQLKSDCNKYKLDDFFYPILDSIISRAPYQAFHCGLELKPYFYRDLLIHIQSVKERNKKYNACFLADSSYLDNHIFKQLFINSGRSVFYLNPSGQILKYTSIFSSKFSASPSTLKLDSIREKSIDLYLSERFSSKSLRDIDSRKVFSGQLVPSFAYRKKVLFLHAFRDANNTDWRHGQPFSCYHEWVDYTLSEICKNKAFNSWYIKQHSSSSYYSNEDNILGYLLDKYRVPPESLVTPSTPEIIKSKMPIYTNNGTIVLESACHGFASYFCGSRFDPQLGIYASSKEEWSHLLTLPATVPPRVSSHIARSAKISLWESFSFKNVPELCPNRPIHPKANALEKLSILLGQTINTLATPSTIKNIPVIK